MLKKISLLLLTLLLLITTLELAARQGSPVRWQRVYSFETLNGVPVWTPQNTEADAIRNADCARGSGADIVLLGDSIFYGAPLPAQATLGPTLSQALHTASSPDACVVNLSVPAFNLDAELAVIERDWPELHPQIVVLEIWHNSPHLLSAIGDAVYNFGSLKLDSEGLPNPLNLQPRLNRLLFSNSTLWQHLIEGLATDTIKGETLWKAALPKIVSFNQWLVERDAQLILVFPSKLKNSWDAGRERERQQYSVVADWARDNQIPMRWFDEILSVEPVEDVRIDTCCHLSNTGMELVTDELADTLQPMLLPPPPESPEL